MTSRRLALAVGGLSLLGVVAVGGRALAAEGEVALPAWAVPTGGGLGAGLLGLLVWGLTTGRISLMLGRPEERQGVGRREADEEAGAALARARLEGRREAEGEALRLRVDDLERQVDAAIQLLGTVQQELATHRGDHRALDATLTRVDASLAALTSLAHHSTTTPQPAPAPRAGG